jgi:predicted ATPase
MRFAGVYLRDFEPFAEQAVEFPEKPQPGLAEVHFFVGENGTGKTRILSLLAAACGNSAELKFRTSKTSSTAIIQQNSVAGARFLTIVGCENGMARKTKG